jgi:acetylornithine deacetylase/succinyl-diaminopimelate desuccinylase-like protein
MGEAMFEYLSDHRTSLIDELSEWIRLPSIAGVPEHEPDLARSANWLAARLGEIGFPVVGVWPAESGPAVYAEWCAAPGAPTVLIYSHHDVRAAKDDQWDQTAPFERRSPAASPAGPEAAVAPAGSRTAAGRSGRGHGARIAAEK